MLASGTVAARAVASYGTNAGNGGQQLRHRIYSLDESQLTLDSLDLLVQFLQLVHKNSQRQTGIGWRASASLSNKFTRPSTRCRPCPTMFPNSAKRARMAQAVMVR
ncbi:hypothetical protein [Bradyrhizobium paxllaeri]|uniref:hypothetical protein n=1 Tax=Bradyrhizobium paxllaeri TaxID=190148 RepID=UPI001FE62839|nr:hypothetical protein [Bradyrhizobium paxllaeri]